MPYSAAEAFKRITGRDLPKPWDERTEAEKLRARDAFLESVDHSTPQQDAAMDEFIAVIQKNLEESRSRVPLSEDVDAA